MPYFKNSLASEWNINIIHIKCICCNLQLGHKCNNKCGMNEITF